VKAYYVILVFTKINVRLYTAYTVHILPIYCTQLYLTVYIVHVISC